MSSDSVVDITCPRCGESASVRFYGPCPACAQTLRATMGSAPADSTADAPRYEPKMNVKANAVALRDD